MKFRWVEGKLVEGEKVPVTVKWLCEEYTVEVICCLLMLWAAAFHYGLLPLLRVVKAWLSF